MYSAEGKEKGKSFLSRKKCHIYNQWHNVVLLPSENATTGNNVTISNWQVYGTRKTNKHVLDSLPYCILVNIRIVLLLAVTKYDWRGQYTVHVTHSALINVKKHEFDC